MNWLRIIHETIYSYKAAVRFGPHRLVLRPREGHDVRVEKMRLEIVPEFELDGAAISLATPWPPFIS
jgi:Bacterial transglutaminase-like N-terminal region